MKKLYLFGIGGTGARVIRALTLLLGSGIKVNADEIVPILIDPDSSNGDVNRTLEILRTYKSIHSFLHQKRDGFFHTPIGTLPGDNEFQFYLEKIQNQKFRDYISYHNLGEGNKFLIDLLFSEKNLNLEMQVGFRGNPNVGSVVLNQMKESIVFRNFANQFSQGDRIFIISSIFGGTGAAGFPLLLKNIQHADKNTPNHALLKEAKIGALTVLPYFGVQRDDSSSIEKESFLPKTKAALDYYEYKINPFLDSIYYIGDSINKDYKNSEGQSLQKNDAHFVELAGALSILDFLDKDDQELQRGTVFKEFGIKSDVEELQFDDLGKKTRELLLKPFSSYSFFMKYLTLKLPYSIQRKQTWTQEGKYKIDDSFINSIFYKTYLTTFNSYFEEWLSEIGKNKRSFLPFKWNIDENNLFSLIKGVHEKKGLFIKNNFDAFDTELNHNARNLGDEMGREVKFLKLFEVAIQSMLQKKIDMVSIHG